MKVIHCNSTDSTGGAARAMLRLHAALERDGIDSRVRVRIKAGADAKVIGSTTRLEKALGLLRPACGGIVDSLLGLRDGVYRSYNLLPSRLAGEFDAADADLVHLHWLGEECMSIADIGAIRKPVVWTLHDMWAFCGAEHLADDGAAARWRDGYASRARGGALASIDIDRLVWRRKQRHWRVARQIVAPSRWLASCVRASALMADWPIEVIPNLLSTDVFRPLDRSVCRHLLGLPVSAPLVLFAAHGGLSDRNKGWDLLEAALRAAVARVPELQCVIVGAQEPARFSPPPFAIRWLGRIQDELLLPVIYGAVDVVAVPSRCENLPQVATEAQACGRPVAAFATAGLPDAVDDGVTGYLVSPHVTEELGAAIANLLADPAKASAFSLAAAGRARELWSPAVVIPRIRGLYEEVLRRHARGQKP